MLRHQLGLKKGRNFFEKDSLENLYQLCIKKMKNNDLSPFIIRIRTHEIQMFFDLDERLPDAKCKRLWRNIHITTIAKQMSTQELSNHLKVDVKGLILNMNRIRKQGGLK